MLKDQRSHEKSGLAPDTSVRLSYLPTLFSCVYTTHSLSYDLSRNIKREWVVKTYG